MADKKPPAPKTLPGWANFVIGGLSGMFAICVVQPMDLIKTRMQLAGPKGSIGEVVGGIMKSEGVFGFYNGLSAALFRQATYTTGRLGCFNAVFDYYQSNFGTPNLAAKIGLGSFAGGVGALIGNPAEIALIRMTADGRLPPDKRRNYKHVIDALARICREEGSSALMRGMTATVTRAMVVNGAQLSTYQQSREMLLGSMADGIPLHATCAMIAGLVTSAASLPVDIVKTRRLESALQAFQELVRSFREGPKSQIFSEILQWAAGSTKCAAQTALENAQLWNDGRRGDTDGILYVTPTAP